MGNGWKRIALLTTTLLFMGSASVSAAAPFMTPGLVGEDVALMQRLLTAGGHPIAITARFGPTTQQFVRDFQRHHGLSADGIVGPKTWAVLTPTLYQGSRGTAVQAVQRALNVKRKAGLTVDGYYGLQTVAALKAFQQHMGLSVTGSVNDATWDALASHFEELPWSGPGWYRYDTGDGGAAWGKASTIALVREVAAKWNDAGYDVRLGVGDISLPHGGPMSGHASHQKGVDVDFRILRNDGLETPVGYWDEAYSRKLTQQLVNLLQATGEVQYIFFNDSRVTGVQHWPGHDTHMHVRFKR